MDDLPVDKMVSDADALARQFSDGSNPVRDEFTADVICHVKALASEHIAQVLNYLKATDLQVGLLINFGNRKLEYRRFNNHFDQ